MDEQDARQFNPLADNLDGAFANCRSSEAFRDLQFEGCVFDACDFTKAAFASSAFVDCRFSDCDLTMAEFPDTAFNGAVFERCRLRGVDWTQVSAGLLSLEFHGCILDYGNFEGMKLKKTPFLKCSAVETTFANSDLRKADFRDAEDLALNLAACQCAGLRLRLVDARGTLQMHGVKVSP